MDMSVMMLMSVKQKRIIVISKPTVLIFPVLSNANANPDLKGMVMLVRKSEKRLLRNQ